MPHQSESRIRWQESSHGNQQKERVRVPTKPPRKPSNILMGLCGGGGGVRPMVTAGDGAAQKRAATCRGRAWGRWLL